MIDRGKWSVFSKLGKISLAIISLAFSIILLFRRAQFSMSLTRVSEHFIYLIGIEKGIVARVYGIWEAKSTVWIHSRPHRELANCEGLGAQQTFMENHLWAKHGPTVGQRVSRLQGRAWMAEAQQREGSINVCWKIPVQSHHPGNDCASLNFSKAVMS